ncbi:OmpW family outer membrane protein [Escherichia coli]|uniref:OmpW family outer membrane protein n=1 Tax=Escherichia coli TaxID=562 RepID=UPI003EBB7FC1
MQVNQHTAGQFILRIVKCAQTVIEQPFWYMDIDTTAKYKSGVTTVKDSVRLDPWVFMFSAGYRF